jgi:hypothetical protein
MVYLYRGVNVQLDEKNKGKLRPKGCESKAVLKISNTSEKALKFDIKNPWVLGNSEINSQRLHQLDVESERWAWLSFSKDKKTAIHFATSGNTEAGYVYMVDERKFGDHGVVKLEKKYPENAHESEVSIRAHDNSDLPDEIVVSKESVQCSWG